MCPCASHEKYELPVMVGWSLNTSKIVKLLVHTPAGEESGWPCIPTVISCQIGGAQPRMRTGAPAHAFPRGADALSGPEVWRVCPGIADTGLWLLWFQAPNKEWLITAIGKQKKILTTFFDFCADKIKDWLNFWKYNLYDNIFDCDSVKVLTRTVIIETGIKRCDWWSNQ